MPKQCFKCGRVKALSQFYRHPQMADGHLNKCKDCARADVRQDYRTNRNAHRTYERNREQTPERKAWKAEYQRIQRARRPQRYRAATAVSNAIRDGRLKRRPCQVCGKVKAQAHHARGYANPLDVDWLCFRHHREAHGQKVGPA